MMDNKEKLAGESDALYRRRGRPVGKNRVPLSREERRARNAQYERERRNETAEVMSQLVEAVNCDPNISNAELLATVVNRIQMASQMNSLENIEELERINANLEAQIATLQSRLGLDDASFELLKTDNDDRETQTTQPISETMASTLCNRDYRDLRQQPKKRKRSERQSYEFIQQEKRTKTKSETWSVDSGIELRSHTVSPPELCLQNNEQLLAQKEQLQPPVEIAEEEYQHVSQAHDELQAELYNQLYNNCESQSSVDSIPCIERLSRSLIVIPAIKAPHRDPYILRTDRHSQPDSTGMQTVDPPCDAKNEIECDFHLPRENDQAFLTDNEKGLLTDWVGSEFQEPNGYENEVQTPLRNFEWTLSYQDSNNDIDE